MFILLAHEGRSGDLPPPIKEAEGFKVLYDLISGLTSLTLLRTRSLKNGIIFSSSLSFGSLYHPFIGMPLSGYAAKFSSILSMIRVLLRSLPSFERSLI